MTQFQIMQLFLELEAEGVDIDYRNIENSEVINQLIQMKGDHPYEEK